jgi:hypothetical protein
MNPATFSEALHVLKKSKQLGFDITTYNDQPEIFHVYRGTAIYTFYDTGQILDFFQGVEAQQRVAVAQQSDESKKLHTKIGQTLHNIDWKGVKEIHECTKKTSD